MFTKSKRKTHHIDNVKRSVSLTDSGISDSINDNVKAETVPLLERTLQFKKSESDLLKYSGEMEDDSASMSILESPFSDDEETPVRKSIPMKDLVKRVNDEAGQFSKEYLSVLEEFDLEQGPHSPPCSTCSVCSSCTTDTWDLLHITDECLVIKPTPLEPEVIQELDRLNNQYSDLFNSLLPNIKKHDNVSNKQEKEGEDDEKLSLKVNSSTEESKSKKRADSCEKDLNEMREWETISRHDDFFITPPDFDFYRDMKSEDIRFEKDTVPWSVKEKSRNKCTEWLNSHHY